jgi:capsular exopolysaccharide synthesis family protein
MLRDQAVLIIGVTLLFVAIGLGYSLSQKKQYQATTSLSVVDPGLAFGVTTTSQLQSALAAQEGGRVARPEVAARVKKVVSTSLTIPELESAVTTRVDPTSNVLSVIATASTPSLAASLANAFAQQDAYLTTAQTRQQYGAQVKALQRDLRPLPAVQKSTLETTLAHAQAIAAGGVPVSVNSLAGPPGSPTQPKTLRNTLIVGLLGIVVAIALADARRARDRRMRRPEEIEAEFDLPLIGHVSRNALGQGGVTVNGRRPLTSADLESFRVLRQNLQLLDSDGGGLRSVAVTSALAQEGKSTIAVMLAHANAAAGKRTLLVECDLRRPALAERLGLKQTPGLSDYLTGKARPEDVLQTVSAIPMGRSLVSNGASVDAGNAGPQFVCITAGTSPRPAELLATERFRAFLNQVSDAYDLVIIDTSPLLAVVDTLELLPLVDGVAICVRAAKTTRDDAARIKEALGRTKERPTGVVLTGVTPRVDPSYRYYQSYAAR